MVGVVDLACQVEMVVEQGDRGSWVVLTIWVGNCRVGCIGSYFDDAGVHPQNRVHRLRFPHPHRCLWQSHNGLWDRGMAVADWLVDMGWCLSCDGSWLQLFGCWRNTRNKNDREKEGGLLDRVKYVTWQHNVRGELFCFYFVYCGGICLNWFTI
jgi:hypothetical protein